MFHQIVDHLETSITLQFSWRERLGFYVGIFLSIGASVLMVHQFLEPPSSLMELFRHAAIVALSYTLCLAGLEGGFLIFWKNQQPFAGIPIKMIWGISFVGFVLGFLVLEPFRDVFHQPVHPSFESQPLEQRFFQIFPIWLLMTFLFIQVHLKKTFALEVEVLQSLNQTLAKRSKGEKASRPDDPQDCYEVPQDCYEVPQDCYEISPNEIEAGVSLYPPFVITVDQETLTLDPSSITHIRVDDHYCDIFVKEGDGVKKWEVHISLQQVLKQLPETWFVQIHRSHAVNIKHISHLIKVPRTYAVVLHTEDPPLPISRHRLSKVMPQLQQFLE